MANKRLQEKKKLARQERIRRQNNGMCRTSPPSRDGGATIATVDAENNRILVRNMPGVPRMSEVIDELAEPVFDLLDKDASAEEVVQATIMAWNIAVFDGKLSVKTLALCGIARLRWGVTRFQQILDVVAAGRREFYPKVDRIIVDVKFKWLPDGDLYFDVMHTSRDGGP